MSEEGTEKENTGTESTDANTSTESTGANDANTPTESTGANTEAEAEVEAEAEAEAETENMDSIEVAGKFYKIQRLPTKQRNAILLLDQILPALYQPRRNIDEEALKELGRSIQEIGLIEPLVVRFIEDKDGKLRNDSYELVVGQRRLSATKKYTNFTEIEVYLINATDEEARCISIEENLRREDLTPIEEIESYTMLIDQEIQSRESLKERYLSMGETPPNRLKTLLTKLDNVQRAEEKNYTPSEEAVEDFHSFMEVVEEIFANLIKPLKLRNFLDNLLPLIIDSNDKILSISAQYRLKRSHIRSLNKIARDFPEDFDALVDKSQSAFTIEQEGLEEKKHLGKMSGKDLDSYYRRLQSKKERNDTKEARILSSPNQRSTILLMARLGIPHQRILERLEITRTTLEKALQEEEDLKGEIQARIETGQQEIHEIAKELEFSEPLVWSMFLEGKSDPERFDILGWNMSVESNWSWNRPIAGFGNFNSQAMAKGREEFSPLLIAHLLTYFVPEGGMIWVPQTTTGTINDTCLAFGRRCWSWNGNDLKYRRPDIEFQTWNLEEVEEVGEESNHSEENTVWPNSKERPDLFFAQTEFWSSKIQHSWSHSNGHLMREKYKQELVNFFQLVHRKGKTEGSLALLVEEERNYENHPANREAPEWRFGEHEYMNCLEKAGWLCTHSIPCSRSKLSISSKEKKELRKKRILTENNRSLVIAIRKTE